MPSPFPGMDPWLERPMVFPTLHDSFIIFLQSALKRSLPAGYFATTSNRVYVDPELKREPDVSVFGGFLPETEVTFPEPWGRLVAVAIEPTTEPIEEIYLEIRSSEDDRLVTAIEVVSLSNKTPGDGRTSYLQKQAEYRAGGVNSVEIDLLRAGRHVTAVPVDRLHTIVGEFDYHCCVTAIERPGQVFVAAFRLNDPLPDLPIPLDPGRSPVVVSLADVFTRTYDEGPFEQLARYRRVPCDPPLTAEQQTWANELLTTRGIRP